MSQWEERITNHPIHNNINNIINLIDEIENLENVDKLIFDDLYRIKTVVKLTLNSITGIDPILIPINNINNINNQLNSVNNELFSFKNNRNKGHINNANGHIDNVLGQLANIPNTFPHEDSKKYIEGITSFRRSAGQHLRNLYDEYGSLKNKFDGLNSNFQDLVNEIKSQKSRLDNAISQFQQQFSAAEENRREESIKSEQSRSDKFNQILEEQKKKIEEEIDNFESEKNTRIEDLTKNANELVNNYTKKSENLIKSLSEDAKIFINYLKEKKAEAENLVHIIANTGMAGGYQKVANQARRTKNLWHVITILSLFGLISFAIIAFFSTIQTDFNLGKFGARTFVAFSFGILAAYAARQAEKNSEFERTNRQLELELASIDPYLSKLPEDKQFEIKRVLAEKWFGNKQIHDKQENKMIKKYSGNLFDLLKLVLDNITKK